LSAKPIELNAHVYPEEDGNKGGNNVASLILLDLLNRKLMSSGRTAFRLTLILDNCAGQNKNKMVLRLALWLVEMKFFRKVTIMFYIKGHMKNPCDRMCNIMKRVYRDSQVYSFDMLLDILNSSELITAIAVKETAFFDVCEMLDTFYKPMESGTVKKNHIFYAEDSNPTVLHCKEWAEGNEIEQDLKQGTETQETRIGNMLKHENKFLTKPGLKDMKAVDLYFKYRQFLPEEYRDITSPRPEQEIIDKIIFFRVLVLEVTLFGMKGFMPVLGSSNFVNFSI
jgi:hypothetical protein